MFCELMHEGKIAVIAYRAESRLASFPADHWAQNVAEHHGFRVDCHFHDKLNVVL